MEMEIKITPPEGYTAIIENGKIVVKKEESEDEKIRKELLESFKYQQRESRTDKEWLNGIKLSEVVAWLEKQCEQKPVEWSKEDISKLNKIATIIYEAGEVQNWWRQSRLIDKETANELNDWLKSLKNCVQPQWKPSSEYIAALEYQVNSTCKGSWQYKASKELLEQLKKL